MKAMTLEEILAVEDLPDICDGLCRAIRERDELRVEVARLNDAFTRANHRTSVAEAELAALKARIIPGAAEVEIADTDGPDGNPYGWVGGTLLSHNLIGKRVRLVVEE